MKIKIIIFFVFFQISLWSIIEFNEPEIKWLESHDKIEVYVSQSNYPYEFEDQFGKLGGLNIEIIKLICDYIDKDPIFISENNVTNKNAILSNFEFEESGLLASDPIYEINYTQIFNNKVIDKNFVKNIFIVNGSYIIPKINQMYPNANVFNYNNHIECLNAFLKDSNSMLITDNHFFWNIMDIINNKGIKVSTESFESTFRFKLLVNEDNFNLANIISKAIYNLNEEGKTQLLIKKWDKKILEKQDFDKKYNTLVIVFIAQTIITILLIIIILFSKLLRTKIIALCLNYQQTIKKLKNQIKYSEIAVKKMQSSKSSVIDSINSIALTLDLEGNIIYVNSVVQRLLGYRPELLIGRNAKIILKDELENILNIFKGRESTGSVDYGEIELVTRDGVHRIFNYNTQLILMQDDFFAINCILYDITDRKNLEKRLEAYTDHLEFIVKQRTQNLQESEERFKLLVEKTVDGIFLIDKDEFVFVNDSFSKITEYSKEEFLERKIKFSEIIIPSLRNEIKKNILLSKLSHKKYRNIETKIKDKNGRIIDVELNITNAIYNGKRVILGMMRDVTKKKKEEIEKLEKERLLVISQLAVTANDRINSPLNAISGYLEILKMKLENPDDLTKKAISNIEKSIIIIEFILKKLKSMTNITLKDYKLKDVKMFDFDQEVKDFLKHEGDKNE